MPDNTQAGQADRARIDINDPQEVSYRCREYRCTEPRLREAVKAVGVMATDVRAYLDRQKRG